MGGLCSVLQKQGENSPKIPCCYTPKERLLPILNLAINIRLRKMKCYNDLHDSITTSTYLRNRDQILLLQSNSKLSFSEGRLLFISNADTWQHWLQSSLEELHSSSRQRLYFWLTGAQGFPSKTGDSLSSNKLNRVSKVLLWSKPPSVPMAFPGPWPLTF